jgi:hypothetical protein
MKTFVSAFLLSGFLVLICPAAFAQGAIYKWTDAQGRIHFSNTPTDLSAESVDESLPPASAFGGQPESAPAATEPTSEPATPSSPSQTAEAPPPESEPTVAEDEPGLATEGPLAAPEPSTVVNAPPIEPNDIDQGGPAPEDEFTAEGEFVAE